MRYLIVFLLIALPFPLPALARDMTGMMTVHDGDTLKLGKQRIRLQGIDAPEAKQTCLLDGRTWACGTAATEALAAVVQGKTVRCEATGYDIHQRPLATCFVGTLNLNQWLVRNGWAVSYWDYRQEEQNAKRTKRGIWASRFMLPKDWRKQQRQSR